MKYKILIMVLSLSINLFANFEINFYVPLGFNFSFSSITLERPNKIYESIKGDLGFDFALMTQFGYNLRLNNSYNSPVKSISFLLDTGFYMQNIQITYQYPRSDMSYLKFNDDIIFAGASIGFIPKINFKSFSLGLGLGIRIPFAAAVFHDYKDSENLYYEGSLMYKDKYFWDFEDIKKVFKYPVFAYIKLSFDGFYYINNKIAFMYGIYMVYDFSSPYNTDNIQTLKTGLIKKHQVSSLSLNVHFGFSFSRTRD
ncbi:hypothetical protein [uncultured Brachyspira sp.]|uniref:hypothetical protein n=1 Tax=uncultured Brachyspira sp. TaxID=221953 RepID=UPI0025EAA39D|nr:hypothetical protein [uncultured Brachyspira sp.]